MHSAIQVCTKQASGSNLQLKLKPYQCNKKSVFAARVIDISAGLTFVSHSWPKL